MNRSKSAKIRIKVSPRASRNKVVGMMEDGVIKIALTAPPLEGKANKALREFLAKKLDLSKKDIQIVAGNTSRLKTVQIEGKEEAQILGVLLDR